MIVMLFDVASPTDAELRAGDLAALNLLFTLIQWSLIIAAFSAGLLLYRSVKVFGAPKPAKAIWIWISATMSFFAVFMPMTIMFVFSDSLSRSLPGWSILLGLIGIQSVGIMRLFKIWEKRSEQLN